MSVARGRAPAYNPDVLVSAAAALLGVLVGVLVGSPVIALALDTADADADPDVVADRDADDDLAIRRMRAVLAGGQLAGVTAAVAIAGGLGAAHLAIGLAAGAADAAAVWMLVPRSRVFNNALVPLVPGAVLAVVVAAIASALFG